MKVAGGCFAVSAGFWTLAGFSAGFCWELFGSTGFFGSAGFVSAGFGSGGFVFICVDSFVSLASNLAILSWRSFFVFVFRLVAISYTKYHTVYVHCD